MPLEKASVFESVVISWPHFSASNSFETIQCTMLRIGLISMHIFELQVLQASLMALKPALRARPINSFLMGLSQTQCSETWRSIPMVAYTDNNTHDIICLHQGIRGIILWSTDPPIAEIMPDKKNIGFSAFFIFPLWHCSIASAPFWQGWSCYQKHIPFSS